MPAFLSGGGEMGQQVRAYDWSQTSLGLPETWPQSLRTTLGIILNSRFPMFLFWGTELLCFYNDAYRPSLGNDGKHPHALGKPGADVWPEIWHIIKPLIDQVLATGEATWGENQLIPIYRNGKIEDVYWTFSYSPVYDESNQAAGVFVTCTETTEQVRHSRQLEESKSQLEFAIETTELGTWDLDLVTHTFTANDRLKEWIGLPAQTTAPFPIDLDIVAVKDRQRIRQSIEKLLQASSNEYYETEFTLIHPVTQRERIVKAKGRIWLNDEQKPQRFNGTLQDITEQVMSLQATEASESYFRKIADTVPAALWITNKEGQCTYMNRQWFNITGQTPEEALGLGWLDSVHPDDKPHAEATFLQANAKQEPFTIIYRLQAREGGYRWAVDKGAPRWDEAGNFDGYVGSIADVHEQKLAEESVRKSEKRFQAAIAAVQGILWTNNARGEMEGEQPGWAALTGQSYEEYQGYGWASAVHSDDAQPTIDAWNEAVRQRKTFVFEHRVRMKNDEWRKFSIRAIPITNADGSIHEWVGVHTDITEQRQAETALQEREERYRSLFESMDQGFTIIEMIFDEANRPVDYLFLECNPVFETQTGLFGAVGQTARTLVPGLEDRWFEMYGQIALTGQATRFVDGSEAMGRWFEVYAFRLGGAESRQVAILFTDITQRRQNETILKESESRFRTLAETLPQMVWVVNNDRSIEYMSQRWKTYSGLEDTATIWEKIAHPQDLLVFRSHWADHFAQGKSFQYDIRLKNKAGEFRWHNFVAEPIKDASGQTLRWIGSLTDIHNQKNLSEQLEKLVAERTRELQRSNEDLQQFAHVASHDLKEPVRKIKLFSNFLASKCTDTLPEEGLLYLGKIQDAASRMHAMIDGVLLYSSLSTGEQVIESVDLNQILHTIETDLEVIIKQKQARITYQNLPVIQGYSVLLYQLFYNLINNSLKFTKAGVNPLITVVSHPIDAMSWVRIEIRDNGIGFRPEDGQKIFKTFVRLNSKDQYEGTGLGLALCHRIVERHGGTITAEGRDGEGAAFFIDLPVHGSND